LHSFYLFFCPPRERRPESVVNRGCENAGGDDIQVSRMCEATFH